MTVQQPVDSLLDANLSPADPIEGTDGGGAEADADAAQSAARPAAPVEVKMPLDAAAAQGVVGRVAAVLDLSRRVEALLMTSDKPLAASRLAEALDLGDEATAEKRIDKAVADLNEVYDSTGRAFRVERIAGGYRVMTRPEFGPTVTTLAKARQSSKLSQSALETLAIVAYRQPITRADVEAIRGVACGEVLRSLLERRLVKIVGRAEEIGRPMLYGTTREFLESFGLASLKDLPSAKELKTP